MQVLEAVGVDVRHVLDIIPEEPKVSQLGCVYENIEGEGVQLTVSNDDALQLVKRFCKGVWGNGL